MCLFQRIGSFLGVWYTTIMVLAKSCFAFVSGTARKRAIICVA